MHQHAYELPTGSSEGLEFPRMVRWERDYWLGRCLGFRVERAEQMVGRVESLRFETRHDRPDVLVVCGGLLRRRRLNVRVEEIEEIDPRACRILLAAVT